MMPPQIRAIHILRADPHGHAGGDIRQLVATVEGLRQAGVDAIAARWDDAPTQTDIVHLYNIWLPLELHRSFQEARRRWPDARIAITPIFWTWSARRLLHSGDPQLILSAVRSAAKTWATWWLCRSVLKSADAVTPQSDDELEIIRRYFRLDPSADWRPVANGVWLEEWPFRRAADRAEWLAAFGIRGDVKTVVAGVGGIYPNKNQRGVIRAVSDLENVGLLLIGPSSDTKYAESIVRLAEERLPGRWSWIGQVMQPELVDILSFVDVAVSPSFREVSTLVALEAAAVGCEVVTTVCGGAGEQLRGLVHLCEPDSVTSIAGAITNARRHPKQPALRRRVEELDWSKTGQVMAQLYSRLVAR